MPNWNPVRWDWGAVDEALSALQRTTDRVDRTTSERSS